jgi:xanthine dehydrogenase large subunit
VQHNIAKMLGRPDHAVTIEVRRMGGGFGGKETQACQWAAIAALTAVRTGRPAKLRLDRDDDMVMTGKRHDFRVDWRVGFDGEGRIEGAEIALSARCGYSFDLSPAIVDRAVFHSDNAYFLPAVRIIARHCRTNTVSNTAFRGFGGPQGMMAIERVMDAIAHTLGRDPLDVRRANLYGPGRDVTPYGQTVDDGLLPEILDGLERSSDYRARRDAVAAFNRTSPVIKRGLALTPVKFGISFTLTHLNQAGALVHVYTDGSIHLNHGGTEMGQGLFVKVAQVVAETFGVDLDRVKITATTTGKVPNTSATAASSGSDLNGMAAREAALAIRERLARFVAEVHQADPADVVFGANCVTVGGDSLPFAKVVKDAYLARVPLSATGFYKTPKLAYDARNMTGRPFFYFANGAAATEVAIDTLTGEMRVLRVDILHDVGRSLNPAVDLGQIEGGFIQGMGWLTTEELWWDERGRLRTHAPSTYKIPSCGDRPEDMRMRLVEDRPNREETVYRSKAVGEPPFMLALSVFSAIVDAVGQSGGGAFAPLDAPATPERILRAVEAVASP